MFPHSGIGNLVLLFYDKILANGNKKTFLFKIPRRPIS
jgi:hypothetical protein